MDEEEIRQLWAEGQDWIIKRHNSEYSHRLEGKYGEWQAGLPLGVYAPDVEILFEE